MDFNSLLKAMKERMLSEGDCYVINDIKQLELCFQQEDYYSILQLCKELNIKINVVPPPPLPPAHSPKYVPNEPAPPHPPPPPQITLKYMPRKPPPLLPPPPPQITLKEIK
jgi:hypothetical protein